MPGKTKTLSMVRGRVVRLTRLDGCGRPVYGDSSVATSEGFISVAMTTNVEEGEAINVTNAAGKTCVREAAVPTFTGITSVITFCEVDPELFSLATGHPLVLDAAGNAVGFDETTETDAAAQGFALEVWAGAPTEACSENAQGTFGYLLLPYIQGGVVGDVTVENAAVSFTISNATTKDGNGWGRGPYNVMLDGSGNPATLPTALGAKVHRRTLLVEVAPPEGTAGTRPLLDPTAPALTGVTVTTEDLEATFTVAPTGTEPFWTDFGDGYWDYSEDGAALVHEYAEAGTYTAVTKRGTSSFTSTVTVAVTP